MHDQLTALAREIVQVSAATEPLRATALGLPGFDGKLAHPDEAARAGRIARLRAWMSRVERTTAMDVRALSLVDRDDARLLRASLQSELDELVVRQADRKDYARSALNLTGAIFVQFLHLPIVGVDDAKQQDLDAAWDDVILRLEHGAAYIQRGQRLATRPGRLFGEVGSQSLAGVGDFINGALTDAAKLQMAQRPAALARFLASRDSVMAEVARTKAYIDAHDKAWPENYAIGRKAYNQMLRDEQLLPFADSDLEVMSRDELAHGWAEEAWLSSLSAQRGVPFGPASGGGMAPAGPPLVDYYRERIGELRRFVIEHDVVTIPDWLGSMEIVETPAFLQPVSPGASMYSPRLFAKSTTGYYFVTPPRSLEEAAKRLDMNEDFDRDRIWSTAAHESIPGHFLQLSIARRHPDFVRRMSESDVFAEGWAYYGEEMFVRLGMYGDDLDGRLFTARWERVRGARSVVDPKLASGEWSVARAVEFFETQSGFTHEASIAAVNGIALYPGYAIAYTVGRLQLEELLASYLQRSGTKASLRDFHDRLLSYGCVPFSIVAPELLADLDKPASEVRSAAGY